MEAPRGYNHDRDQSTWEPEKFVVLPLFRFFAYSIRFTYWKAVGQTPGGERSRKQAG